MPLHFEVIRPEPFDPAPYREEMVLTMSRLMGGILVDFGKTVETWVDQPSFEFDDIKANDDLVEIHVFCDALRDGDRVKGAGSSSSIFGGPQPAPINLVYFFLNGGTTVRYATMTPDFEPKSRVRWLGSGPGAGGLASVDIRRPRKGIVARKWDEEIQKKYAKIIRSQLASTLIRAGRATGHVFVRGN